MFHAMVDGSTAGAISGMLCAALSGIVLGTGSFSFVVGAGIGL